jgi:hypothetical protein
MQTGGFEYVNAGFSAIWEQCPEGIRVWAPTTIKWNCSEKRPEKEFANGGLGGVQTGDLVPVECPERIQVPCILGVVHPRCLSS